MYRLPYNLILRNCEAVLKYCFCHSDSFSVITKIRKPYAQKPPAFEHEVISQWNECLIEQIIGIKEWPGTKTTEKHKVINYYNCRKFRKTVDILPNFFEPNKNSLPEDICFYRNGIPWFFTVSHEQYVFADNLTEEDITFLKPIRGRTGDGSLS